MGAVSGVSVVGEVLGFSVPYVPVSVCGEVPCSKAVPNSVTEPKPKHEAHENHVLNDVVAKRSVVRLDKNI